MVGREASSIPSIVANGIGLLKHTWLVILGVVSCDAASLTDCFIATSVDVERVFSKGRLVLSHVRNRLSVESTRALMCLGAWSRLDLVKSEDVLAAAKLPDVKPGEVEMYDEWDLPFS